MCFTPMIDLKKHVSQWICLVLVLASTQLQAQDLFPDKGLEAAVRKEVFEKRYNAEPITADDVKNISQVIGKGKGIKSLEGLQHCKSLMKLDLENNEIADLGPIRELKLLQSIDLSGNKIESIEPLSQLLQSQYLQLSKNSISDLAALKEMKNLQSLYLAGNKIKSLEPIANLKKLWTLDVSGSPIENYASISQLKGLTTLNLKSTGLKDLEFVRPLTELKLLIVNDNPIENLVPLAESCEADAKAERRFAPFLRMYIDAKIESDPALAPLVQRLKAVGVRINPEKK